MTWPRQSGVARAAPPVQRWVDPYVPLRVEAGGAAGDPPFYWRLVAPRFSLVELGVDRRDGRFVSLTVTLYRGELHELSRADAPPPGGDESGLPRFDLDPWAAALDPHRDAYDRASEILDTPGRCRLELGGGILRVVLAPGDVHSRVLAGGLAAEFGASGELRAVSVSGLRAEEQRVIAESLAGQGEDGL